jgi:hypothetical protein
LEFVDVAVLSGGFDVDGPGLDELPDELAFGGLDELPPQPARASVAAANRATVGIAELLLTDVLTNDRHPFFSRRCCPVVATLGIGWQAATPRQARGRLEVGVIVSWRGP